MPYHPQVSLFGFAGFGNVWMLLWGGAAVIPIVIHLWSRRRHQVIQWAAVSFLLAAIRKNARRIRLKQLILLAIRVCIPLLLALALSEPFLRTVPGFGQNVGSSNVHYVLVFDASFSMGAQDGDLTRFEKAKQSASQLIERSQPGDGFSVILMGDSADVIIGSPAFDGLDVMDEIQILEPTDSAGQVLPTLAAVQSTISSARTQHQNTAHLVYFFSDLGQATWQDMRTPEGRGQMAALADEATLSVVDVGEAGLTNAAIVELREHDAVVTRSDEVQLQATIQSHGHSSSFETDVTLIVDGRIIDQQQIRVPAQGQAVAAFRHRFARQGEHAVEARLADDALAVDNHRYRSLFIRDAVRCLCVAGRPGAARNVALALDPESRLRASSRTRPKLDVPRITGKPISGGFGFKNPQWELQSSRIRVQTIGDDVLTDTELDQFDCVFLCNLRHITHDAAAMLSEYVRGGGGLVFFLGDPIDLESYNSNLGRDSGPNRVLPATLKAVAPDGQYVVDPRDYAHPIVNPFRGHERTGLLTTPIWRYVLLDPIESEKGSGTVAQSTLRTVPETASESFLNPTNSSRVALWLGNGDPLIVEESIHGGRSIIVATTASDSYASTPWSALSTWPSFPPLVHEILNLAVSHRLANRNLQIGQDISGVAPQPSSVVTVTRQPSDTATESEPRQRIPLRRQDDTYIWTLASPTKSGIYRARYGSREGHEQVFAVNVDTRESDPQRIDPSEFPSVVQVGVSSDEIENAVTASTGTDGLRWPVFRSLLYMLLALLLLESSLAWQFGRASG